jgi:hypothetical protein
VPVDSPEDLYGLPLEQFIEERTALAKRLRAEKDPGEAKRVGALKKPTVAAWAVNQLVRTQPKAVRALFAAGDDLAAAQSSGRAGAEKLRDAAKQQRAVLDELMGAAEGLLDSDGHPLAAQTLERVGETLRAAAIDPAAREQLEPGCLTKELQATGLLGLSSGVAASPPPAETKKADREAAKKAAQAERRAEKEAEQAVKELKAAQKRREQADQAVEQAEKRAEAAAAELQRARDELERLEDRTG